MPYILGIDTGGTNTDSVILDSDTKRLLKKSKAFTTKNALEIGIQNSINALGLQDYSDIELVCLSTTLATNAIVERKGCKTGIIAIGSLPKGQLPTEHVYLIPGKLDIKGNERTPLKESDIISAVHYMKDKVEAVAISGFASVRNPSQEQRVMQAVNDSSRLPVFCAHMLSDSLGYLERTVTAALNASLIKIIDDFLIAVKSVLRAKDIHAPIMVIKSDGTLMSEDAARKRPIDTVLSGPAASILGAIQLTGLTDGMVVDIGGTTTDISYISGRSIQTENNGARVDGWRTHCRAAKVSTYGVGGDSKIVLDEENRIIVGPQKVTPLCVAASLQKELCAEVFSALESGNFAGSAISESVAFTPTDLLCARGIYTEYESLAPRLALEYFARQLGLSFDEAAMAIETEIVKKITFSCVQCASDFENKSFDYASDPVASYLLDKAFTSNPDDFLHSGLYMQKPIIGVGAPSAAWLKRPAKMLHTELFIPEHAEVANAVGAAVATFKETASALIRPAVSGGYSLFLPEEKAEFSTYEEACSYANNALKSYIISRMAQQGIPSSYCDVKLNTDELYTEVFSTGKRNYIETRITAFATVDPLVIARSYKSC